MTATAEPHERTTRVTTWNRHLLVAGAGLVILVLCGLVQRALNARHLLHRAGHAFRPGYADDETPWPNVTGRDLCYR